MNGPVNPIYAFILALVLVVGGGAYLALAPKSADSQLVTAAVLGAIAAVIHFYYQQTKDPKP